MIYAFLVSLPLILEEQLRGGAISPNEAIERYCSSESTSKQQDAFCACPEEALELLRKRLSPFTN